MERLLTPQEVADQLKIKKATVYELIKRGELNSSKIGKQLRISEKQLQEYIGQTAEPAHSYQAYQPRPLKSDVSYPESSMVKKDFLSNTTGLIISGQDSALDFICSMIEDHPQGVPTLRSIANCYNSLYALYFEKTHIGTVDLWNTETKNYNIPFVKNMLPGIAVTLIHVLKQPVGFYVKKDNPKGIISFADLTKPEVHLANREKGSGARIFLDQQIKQQKIDSQRVSGYHQEMLSAFACARAVADGKADVALGNESTLVQFPMLDFITLGETYLDLVIPTASLKQAPFEAFLAVMASRQLKSTLSYLKGCDISHTGEIIHL